MRQNGSNIYEFETFRLDAGKRLVFRDTGETISLMPKAFDTLLYLVANSGRVIDKDELFREVWPDTIVEENNLTQNISVLRKVLGEKPGEHRFIATVPGKGYRFVADVRYVDAPLADVGPSPDGESTAEPPSSKKLWLAVAGLAALLLGGSMAAYFVQNQSAHEDPIRSIAVLPFKPLTSESSNESMELGMADSLISRLSEGEDLVVRPLFSVRRFASPDEDPVAVGQTLKVEAVLDGSIQLSPDQVRVSARLFRVSDGKHIWSEQFDEKRTDIFEIQDRIAERVARALNTRLAGKTDSAPANLKAYENYMLGRVHAYRLILPEVQKGIAYYEQSIAADPNYALPYVGIAEAQRALVMSNDLDPRIAFVQAKALAAKAVELDSDLAESHLAVGMIAFIYDWDWPLAEKHLATAVELRPNDSESRILYAHLLSNLGRHDEALREATRARELNPISPIVRTLEGLLLAQAGRTDEAVKLLEVAVSVDTNFWLSHHLLASAYLDNGMLNEAIAESDAAKRLAPFQTHSAAFTGLALARNGQKVEARRLVEELIASSRERYVPPCHIALIFAGLGENSRALDYLESAYREKDVRMVFLKSDGKWDNLRAEPRFAELMRKMNLL